MNEPPAPEPKVVIASITFAPSGHLPEPIQAEMIKAIRSPELHDSADKTWVDEVQEIAVHRTLQDAGYFLATEKVDATLLEEDSGRNQYALTIHINEGRQYTLGALRFVNAQENEALIFSVRQLREQFRMEEGDIFSSAEIRDGLGALTTLYGSHGYIDMTPEPEMQVDSDGAIVNLLLKIDEQRQYRIGELVFLGLTEKARLELRTELKSGDVLNVHLVDELISQNRSLLPADVSREDVEFRRNVADGTVDITFNFWSCPYGDHESPH